MKQKFLEGVYAASLTPMRPDLSCNHKELFFHCSDLVERGCKGVVLFGTTGEGPSFSLTERKEALDALVSKGFDPQKIILGNGSSGIHDTVELAREALRQGCLALLIAPPSYYKGVPDEGVTAFYREVIQKVADPKLRILLYHIPHLSGVPISMRVIETLCKEFSQIVIGIKESEKDLPFTKALLSHFDDFKVFVGHEGHIIEAVHAGAAGSICGIANLYPELICSLYEKGKSLMGPNPQKLEALFEALKGISFIAASKAVMKRRRGELWHAVRPPLLPLEEAQKERFIAALQTIGLE